MFIFSVQVLALALIVQCLGPSIVLGRPRIKEKTSVKTGVNGRLRDSILLGNARRFKRFLQTPLRGGLRDIFVKETRDRHLGRIGRDLTSLSQNPCFKQGSYQRLTLSNGVRTYRVQCEASTNVGCFNAIPKYTTAKCTEVKVYFPKTGQTLVQNCQCAS